MYEIGITEINTHVRRLGYVSAILKLLEHKTLSESLLYNRLERWSLNHEQDLTNYTNPQGHIKATRGRTGAKRYTEFAASLGLLGRIAGACRVTRFGKPLLPFLNQVSGRSPFELTDTERCAYLYWLLRKDSDQLLTVLTMLVETPNMSLSGLQSQFQEQYLRQLDARILIEETRVAREILAVRNRVAQSWKASQRGIEHIVPPRIHWLADLGLASIGNGSGKIPELTAKGHQFYQLLPRLPETDCIVHTSPAWLQQHFFGVAGRTLLGGTDRKWAEIQRLEQKELLGNLANQAFETLRSTPTPKIALYPALFYMALFLLTEHGIGANLDELHKALDTSARALDSRYEVRFSRRENESYLIFRPI